MVRAVVQSKATRLEWITPPKQQRSQRTLERLLDAAEALIEERGVDGITISAVVKKAGSSVGAFYARFGDKESLLRCVFERFYEQAGATADAALEPSRWADVSLSDAIGTAIAFTVHVFRERRGVIAALLSHANDNSSFASPAEMFTDQIAAHLLALTVARGEVITHPEPQSATRACVWLVLAALSSWAHAGASERSPASAKSFTADATQMCIAFLFCPRT